MKKILLFLITTFCFLNSFAQSTITIMDSVVFYDGYASVVTTQTPPPGVIRHRNDLFARKLTSAEIAAVGTTLQMKIVIKALCDNYDRIGNVNLALVPAGATTYVPDNVQHIELGRFITPFMNKNVQPDSVPYLFNIDNVAMLLKEPTITNTYDIWIELAVFGVPYAANTQVAGCSGRNDVFLGKLQFITNAAAPVQSDNVLTPLFFNNNFNNYQAGATDTIGKTTKTITFNVANDLTDAALFLITSNHGANSGGEEYNRRFHYAYFDNALKLTYKPGRPTCEPFRQFNTQGNGIYGSSPKTNAQWQSFSNWCPGDVIDIRRINLGPVSAGNHTFLITVPTAIFNGGQGNFPLSLYLQGKTTGMLTSIEDGMIEEQLYSIYPNPTNGQFTVVLPFDNCEITVTNTLGQQVIKTKTSQRNSSFQINNNGLYFVTIKTNKETITRKLIVNN
jgi:hypothetical protein